MRRRQGDGPRGARRFPREDGDAVFAAFEVDGPGEDGVEAGAFGENRGLVDPAGPLRDAVDLLQGGDVRRESADRGRLAVQRGGFVDAPSGADVVAQNAECHAYVIMISVPTTGPNVYLPPPCAARLQVPEPGGTSP